MISTRPILKPFINIAKVETLFSIFNEAGGRRMQWRAEERRERTPEAYFFDVELRGILEQLVCIQCRSRLELEVEASSSVNMKRDCLEPWARFAVLDFCLNFSGSLHWPPPPGSPLHRSYHFLPPLTSSIDRSPPSPPASFFLQVALRACRTPTSGIFHICFFLAPKPVAFLQHDA